MTINYDAIRIYDLDTLYPQMMEELGKKSVVIDMANVHEIDLSGIQLLISLKNSCDEKVIPFSLENVNSEITALLTKYACSFLLESRYDC